MQEVAIHVISHVRSFTPVVLCLQGAFRYKYQKQCVEPLCQETTATACPAADCVGPRSLARQAASHKTGEQAMQFPL